MRCWSGSAVRAGVGVDNAIANAAREMIFVLPDAFTIYNAST